MKHFHIDNNSSSLILFFSGWGCDEYEFEHMTSESDVLILYDYTNLNLDFDFSKYKNIDLIAFSAGVFVASIFDLDLKIRRKIAIDGNPYLFDEYLGLSKDIQKVLTSITEENAEDFAKNYLVKTKEEYENFHPSRRTLESCNIEYNCLKQIYNDRKQDIKDIFDIAYIGDQDLIFNVEAQKEFYKNRLRIIKNARHNVFFRLKRYEDIYEL